MSNDDKVPERVIELIEGALSASYGYGLSPRALAAEEYGKTIAARDALLAELARAYVAVDAAREMKRMLMLCVDDDESNQIAWTRKLHLLRDATQKVHEALADLDRGGDK